MMPRELVDTAPIATDVQRLFLGHKVFTNLTWGPNNCAGAETKDIAMTPAIAAIDGAVGFDLAVGGTQVSGGPVLATAKDGEP